MKNAHSGRGKTPHLVWVVPGELGHVLFATTTLETTRALRKMGWKITLISSDSSSTTSLNEVDLVCLPGPNIYLLRHLIFNLRLYGYLIGKWSSIDFIFFNQLTLPWILPLKFLRWVTRSAYPQFVLDTRTLPMEDPDKATLKDQIRGKFYLKMNQWGNHWADGQTAITQRMADELNIPSEKLWGVWPSGANLDQFAISAEWRQLPEDDQPVSVIYIGSLHYERNLMALCKAIEMANSEGMKFTLNLTGEGTEKTDLEKFASQTQGRIVVNGSIPFEKIPALLSTAQIGALPFPDDVKYRVCSPIKLFEYLASGLAILATKIVCHTDVLGDGKFVFWAENAQPEGLLEALRIAWKSRADFKEMEQEAIRAADEYSWQRSAEKLATSLMKGANNIPAKKQRPIRFTRSESELE